MTCFFFKPGKSPVKISDNDEVELDISFANDPKKPSSGFSGSFSTGISGGLSGGFWYGGGGTVVCFIVGCGSSFMK